MADRADLNQNLTVTGGPSLEVKKVSQVILDYGKFDVNADNRTLDSKQQAYKSGSTGQVNDVADKTLIAIANNGGPREQMSGQRNSKHYDENGKAFRSWTGNLADSDMGN